jgi:hypothetical protein
MAQISFSFEGFVLKFRNHPPDLLDEDFCNQVLALVSKRIA